MTTGRKKIAIVILFITQRNIISATLRKRKVYKHKVTPLARKTWLPKCFQHFTSLYIKSSQTDIKIKTILTFLITLQRYLLIFFLPFPTDFYIESKWLLPRIFFFKKWYHSMLPLKTSIWPFNNIFFLVQ